MKRVGSGRAILSALIAGESDPERLAELAQGTARKKRTALIEALHGRITPHHRRLLKLHLDLIGALEAALAEVDAEVGNPLAPIHKSAGAKNMYTESESVGFASGLTTAAKPVLTVSQ